MVHCYESKIIPNAASNESLQSRIAALEKSGKELEEALVHSEARANLADNLKKELEKAHELGKVQDQRVRFFEAAASSSKEACDAMTAELHSMKARLKEQELKNEALVKLRDHDLKVSAHSARKAVKTRGQILFDDVSEYLRCAKARKKAESELVEIKSNKLLLDQISEGKISASEELEALDIEMKRINEQLSSLPPADFDLGKYSEYFVDSPPIDESGLSLTCDEVLPGGSVEVTEKVNPTLALTPTNIEVNFIIPPAIYQFGSNFCFLGYKQVSELRTPVASEVDIQLTSSEVPPQIPEKDPLAVTSSDFEDSTLEDR